jgi:hypothetical protein
VEEEPPSPPETLASAPARQPFGPHVQVNVCALSHSSGYATHAPVPSENVHHPQPWIGVHVPHEANWLQESA